MAYDPAIGTRTNGQNWDNHVRWYICAVCGLTYTESQTRIPESPQPHAGLRVCNVLCADEPSYDYYQITAPYRPTGSEFEP